MVTLIGDNSGADTEQQRKIRFMSFVRKDIEIQRKIKELQEDKKNGRKIASTHGFAASKIEHFGKVLNLEDKDKAVNKHQSDRENLIWLGLIPEPGKSADLFDDRVTREQEAYAKGEMMGMLGGDRVSGYDAGGTEDKAWLQGYDFGKAEYDRISAELEAKKLDTDADADDPFPG